MTWVERTATGTVWGLETKSSELATISLEKRKLRGETIATFKYLKG